MKQRRYQVFISSTFNDLKEERLAVLNQLLSINVIPVGMELFPAADEEQFALIKKLIEESDYYVLIVAGRYGSLADDGLSYTEKEYDYAIGKRIPVLAFLHERPGMIPLELTDPNNAVKLDEFRKKIESSKRLVKYWNNAYDLGVKVQTALFLAFESKPRVGWVRDDPSRDSSQLIEQLNQAKRLNEEKQKAIDAFQRELEMLRAKQQVYTVGETAQLDDETDMNAFIVEKETTVFLSYCNKEEGLADIVDLAFRGVSNLTVRRWTRDVDYREDFKAFMKRVKEHDFVIMLISDNFLKSQACMYEVGELLSDNDFKKKLLFIVIDDNDKMHMSSPPDTPIGARVYDFIERTEYFFFWQERYKLCCERHDKIEARGAKVEQSQELREIERIIDQDLGPFLDYLKNARGMSFDQAYVSGFVEFRAILGIQTLVEFVKRTSQPHPPAKPRIRYDVYTIGRWNEVPLDWLVLDVRENESKALLIAKDCLIADRYNEEQKDVTWADCTLRKMLQAELLGQIFNDKERNMVMRVKNNNPYNKIHGTPGGDDTNDTLFLLSIDEAEQYFPDDNAAARVARLNGDIMSWWLRSPGLSSYCAAYVFHDGFISDLSPVSARAAVRPAFWLKLPS